MRRVSMIVLALLVSGVAAVWVPTPARAAEPITISGRVTDQFGVGIRHVRIELHAADEIDTEIYFAGALTDTDGYYRTSPGPGRFYVEVEDPFYHREYPTTFYPGTRIRAEAQVFDLEPGQVHQLDFTLTTNLAGPVPASVDRTSMTAVGAAYRTEVQDHLDVQPAASPANQATACRPVTSSAATAAARRTVNFARSLGQVEPLQLDRRMTPRAEYLAMMLALSKTVNPLRDGGIYCNTATILRDTLNVMNTDRGGAARGISAMLADHAEDAHGRLDLPAGVAVLEPTITSMGVGTAGRYTSLDLSEAAADDDGYPYVDGAGARSPALRMWPTSGYFPAPFVGQRWTILGNNMSYNLDRATLTVSGPGVDADHPIEIERQGHDVIVWRMPELPAPPRNGSADYAIRVTNVGYRGWYAPDIAYDVRVFDPRLPIRATAVPVIAGTPRVGSVLTARATWDASGVVTRFQWLRNGAVIPGATRAAYTPGASDVGRRLAVRVIGTRPSYFAGSAQSGSTAVVVKQPAVLVTRSTRPRKRSFTVTAIVSAGREPGTGTVQLREGARVRAGVVLRRGTGTLRLARVSKGTHRYVLSYGGSGRLAAAVARLTVRVR